MIEKIYFDMDGVLVNFNGGVEELCGVIPESQGTQHRSRSKEDEMWTKIASVPHFYSKLKPIDDSFKLISFARELVGYENVEILTGIPKPNRKVAFASEDKIKWIKEYIDENIIVNTCLRAEKSKFAKNSAYILIDDHPGNIKAWNKAGGTGILFKSVESTLKLLEGMNMWTSL